MEFPMGAILAQISMNSLPSHHLKLISLKIYKCQALTTITGKMSMTGNGMVFFLTTLPRNLEWKDHTHFCRNSRVSNSSQIYHLNCVIIQNPIKASNAR